MAILMKTDARVRFVFPKHKKFEKNELLELLDSNDIYLVQTNNSGILVVSKDEKQIYNLMASIQLEGVVFGSILLTDFNELNINVVPTTE